MTGGVRDRLHELRVLLGFGLPWLTETQRNVRFVLGPEYLRLALSRQRRSVAGRDPSASHRPRRSPGSAGNRAPGGRAEDVKPSGASRMDRLTFESFGVVGEVVSDDPELLDAAGSVLPPGWQPSEASPSVAFGVMSDGSVTLDGVQGCTRNGTDGLASSGSARSSVTTSPRPPPPMSSSMPGSSRSRAAGW